MPFPKNQEFSSARVKKLKPGQFYCGGCTRIISGLSTLDVNGRRVGECCGPTSFRPMFAIQKHHDGR